MFLDTVVYISTRFNEKAVFDAKTHFKQMETFQQNTFHLCQRILRTNSSEVTFKEVSFKLKKDAR